MTVSSANARVKTTAAGTTYYLLDDRNPSGYVQVLAEYSDVAASVPPKTVYTYGHDLIAQRRNTGSTGSPVWVTSYYGYDGLGSVRLLTDSASGAGTAITDTYDYDAYGMLLTQTGTTPNAYRYTGEQWDEDLKLYYLRARFYKPGLGRFWTMDSYEGGQSDPLSLHKYLYCHSNPFNGVDPSGHEFNLMGINISSYINAGLQSIRTTGVAMAKRAALNSLYCSIIGAAVGQWDAIIAGEDPYEGLVNGAEAGALFGALGSVKVLQPFLEVLGGGLTVDGIFRAAESKKYGLAAYRAIVGGGLIGASLSSRFEQSVWDLPPIKRGIASQTRLAQSEYADWYEVGTEANGFFEAVDFQKGNNLVSLRTCDTRGQGSWVARVRGYVRELAGNRAATVDGKPANLILDLRVPPGCETAAEFLIAYGKSFGITVKVSSIR